MLFKKNILLIILLLSFFQIFSEDNQNTKTKTKPTFRMMINTRAFPFIFDPKISGFGNAINHSMVFGAQIKNFFIGSQIFLHVIAFGHPTQFDQPKQDLGIEKFNYKLNLICGYSPVKRFELQWGTGINYMLYFYRNLNKNIIYLQTNSSIFLSLNLDFTFNLTKYFQLRLINDLDINLWTEQGGFLAPIYYGGIRFNIHPSKKAQWLNLSFEIGGMPWTDVDNLYTITTGLIMLGTGISLDLTFSKKHSQKNNTKFKIKKRVEDNTTDTIKTTNEKTKSTIEEKIELINNAQEGDEIGFPNIQFLPDSDEIISKSYFILDKIAKILLKRDSIEVEIGGYTNSTGHPTAELELSIKRAMKVVAYFIEKGISPSRMKPAGYGSSNSITTGVNEANRRVVIKILKIGH